MRYLYRLLEGAVVVGVLTSVMQQKGAMSSADGDLKVSGSLLREGLIDFDRMRYITGAKKLCLDVMGLAGGSSLGAVSLLRIDYGGKDRLSGHPSDHARLIVVLNGIGMLTSGDETMAIKSGDIWMFDVTQDGLIQNSGQDELLLLLVDVRLD